MFSLCLSKTSTGQGLREVEEKRENVTFLNRSECCDRFAIPDSDDNVKIIEEITSKVPTNSVLLFDEVPLFCKREEGRPSYNWSSLTNLRPEEVTVVVCLQPIRLDVTFLREGHDVVVPTDADVIELINQYRNTTNILQFVNQLRQHLLPVEYANVEVVESHEVQGPEITAVSITDLNEAEDLGVWLCNHLQRDIGCKPTQVKMIHLSSTKELVESVISRSDWYERSLVSINDFQGCETPVAVIFWGTDSNYSQLLEMCSRAQYKLVLVIHNNPSLCDIIRTETQIIVQSSGDLDTKPALLTAVETGNLEHVRQLLDCGASTEVCNVHGLNLLQIATKRGFSDIRQELLDRASERIGKKY